jgi:hypothetical protein
MTDISLPRLTRNGASDYLMERYGIRSFGT